MSIIVFQHWDVGGAGRLGATLRDHGLRLEIRRPDKEGERAIPVDYDDVTGVVVLGGPQSVVAGAGGGGGSGGGGGMPGWLEREGAWVKGAVERGLPMVGVCLGAQLLAKVFGGEVVRGERAEFGLCRVDQTAAGNTETLLSGVPWHSWMFQSHEDVILKAPPAGGSGGGGVVLQTSKVGGQVAVQSFRVGLRAYGVQYHFEADARMIEAYVKSHSGGGGGGEGGKAGLMTSAGVTADEVRKQVDEGYDNFSRLADRLCVNLATYVFCVGKSVAR